LILPVDRNACGQPRFSGLFLGATMFIVLFILIALLLLYSFFA